jgi:aryl-alcohol dehydrogenase-like predicted oxidoreductase
MASPVSQNSRLVLGTVQFGMQYGIANKTGQPGLPAVESIVAEAWKSGVREFDTAQAYGESECVLGQVLRSLGIAQEATVVSKFHPDIDHLDSNALGSALQQTLARLKLTRLHGLMLHRETLLEYWGQGLGKTLRAFVDEGLVEHTGVSVYTPPAALRALRTTGIDLVQLPSNLLDRRFENAGVFREAQRCGKQVYLRSVFLQGLLLINVGDLPESMRFARPVIERLADFSRKTGFSPKQLALGYVRSVYPTQKVILGCETLQQVTENIQFWSSELPKEIIAKLRREFENTDEKILNPSLWG